MTSKHTAIITVPNRTIKHGEYMAAYGACETHTSIFSTYVRLPKTAVVSYVYTNGNVEINIETRSRLSKTVMDEITRFIECGFILEANIDNVELVEKPAPVETVKEQEAAQPVASPAPFCQAVAMAVAAYIPPFEVCGSWEVDVHFQASRQLEAWQAAHPDVDIFPLIFGFFVDDDIEIEDFDLGEPGPREGEEEEDLHPTHGALPAWMYEDEQEPYALSHAPMQQQREQEQPPIIETLHAMLSERRDKPGQDMLLRLVQEYEDEGAGNDGLLFAYIKEAAQTLYEVYERVKPEQ